MRVRSCTTAIGVVGALSDFVAAPAEAQQRVASVEVVTGYAGYVDDAWDNRALAGGVVRFALTPRFTIGPEVVYLRGRRGSHEVTVTGTGTFGLICSNVSRRVVPFVVIGVGLLRQSSLVGGGPGTTGLFPYSTREATVSGGFGARISVGRGLFNRARRTPGMGAGGPPHSDCGMAPVNACTQICEDPQKRVGSLL